MVQLVIQGFVMFKLCIFKHNKGSAGKLQFGSHTSNLKNSAKLVSHIWEFKKSTKVNLTNMVCHPQQLLATLGEIYQGCHPL